MLIAKNGAAAATTTPTLNYVLCRNYQGRGRLSRGAIRENLQTDIGELLLYLQNPLTTTDRERLWGLLAPALGKYVVLTHGGAE